MWSRTRTTGGVHCSTTATTPYPGSPTVPTLLVVQFREYRVSQGPWAVHQASSGYGGWAKLTRCLKTTTFNTQKRTVQNDTLRVFWPWNSGEFRDFAIFGVFWRKVVVFGVSVTPLFSTVFHCFPSCQVSALILTILVNLLIIYEKPGNTRFSSKCHRRTWHPRNVIVSVKLWHFWDISAKALELDRVCAALCCLVH